MRGKYRSWTRVRNFASVFCPLVVMTMFMGKGSVEDVADVGHRVHADGRALENGALKKGTARVKHPDFKSIHRGEVLPQRPAWKSANTGAVKRLKVETVTPPW